MEEYKEETAEANAVRPRRRGDSQSDARLDAALCASGVVLAPHAHQRDAVQWWVEREGTTEAARATSSGGILADEMGLGKSMSAVMSVMLCRSALAGPAPRPPAPTLLPGTWAGTSAPVAAAGRASAGGRVVLAPTLIVCPKSLLIQWEREILRHTTLGPADIHLFYGRAGRRITRRQITDKVFVLTTYEIVLGSFEHSTSSSPSSPPSPSLSISSSFSSSSSSSSLMSTTPLSGRRAVRSRTRLSKAVADIESLLHSVEWDRIVLDEAHVIRNWQTSKTHRAVCALRAQRRWCLTGTAFNNSASDVIALCRFVGIAPYSDPQWWAGASEEQAAQWRATFLLRRTKASLVAPAVPVGHPAAQASPSSSLSLSSLSPDGGASAASDKRDIPCGGPPVDAPQGPMSLPPKVEKVRRVALSEREAAFYDRLAVGAVADFSAFVQSKGSDKSRMFGQMLEWLTRLRQACCDPLVLKGRAATIVYSPASRTDLARHESCCVRCHAAGADSLALARLACGHASCVDCAHETADACVLCFGAVDTTTTTTTNNVADAARAQRPMPTEPACGPSSRTASMVRFMNKIFARDRQCKMVVFSQWSTYLDLVESAVVTHVGVDYVRIDGAVRQIERRNALVNRFATDPSARCLLMTIGVGSVGLNLVCANYVLLMDAHYNPFAEAQAVDRVHRIGQMRPVRVVRFLSDASVDAAVAQIQAVKRAGAAAFLGGVSSDGVLDGGNNGVTDRSGAASGRSTAMARGIDERQLRSILGEMIAARRDMGDTAIDPFVLTKSSPTVAPTRGMQCNRGIAGDENDADDDIDDDDGDYLGDEDEDDGVDSDGDHAHYNDPRIDSDCDADRLSGTEEDDDDAIRGGADGNGDDDKRHRPTPRPAPSRAPPSHCRFVMTPERAGTKQDDDDQYDIDLDDHGALLGTLPRRDTFHRLKRTADVVRRGAKQRRLTKRRKTTTLKRHPKVAQD
nr:ATP-dependent helicase rhp16 [Pandoravirus massiliensis]